MKLKSGRVLAPHSSIIGICFTDEDDALYEGYDGVLAHTKEEWDDMSVSQFPDMIDRPLTPEEKKELATIMVNRWSRWGGL